MEIVKRDRGEDPGTRQIAPLPKLVPRYSSELLESQAPGEQAQLGFHHRQHRGTNIANPIQSNPIHFTTPYHLTTPANVMSHSP